MSMPRDLLEGYRIFREERFQRESSRYRTLAEGQRPRTMIIGCADSRVDPATIFSAGPGQLFIVRNVAALVPPYEEAAGYHGTSAAVEFAVTGLGVENIVVLGHGLCGGVAAALAAGESKPVGRFIGPWVELLAEARERLRTALPDLTPAERQRALEHMAVARSLANLATFPFVAEAMADGRLKLEGAWFSIAEGQLLWRDPATEVFGRVEV
jgi:carbonic anhydrase